MRHSLIDEGNSHKIRSVLTMQGGRRKQGNHTCGIWIRGRARVTVRGWTKGLPACGDGQAGGVHPRLPYVMLLYVLIAQSPSNSGGKAKGVDYCSFPNVWTISDHIPSPSPSPSPWHVTSYHVMPSHAMLCHAIPRETLFRLSGICRAYPTTV